MQPPLDHTDHRRGFRERPQARSVPAGDRVLAHETIPALQVRQHCTHVISPQFPVRSSTGRAIAERRWSGRVERYP